MNQSSPLRQRTTVPGGPFSSSLKSALAVLVLSLFGLLVWQVLNEYHRSQDEQRTNAVEHSADLAERLELNMALFAEASLNRLLLAPADGTTAPTADESLDLRTALRLSHDGRPLAAPGAGSPLIADLGRLVQRAGNARYWYSNSPDGSEAWLLLRDPRADGYWLLRFAPSLYASLTTRLGVHGWPQWMLINSGNHVIYRDPRGQTLGDMARDPRPLSEQEREIAIATYPLASSDWQLYGLFDPHLARLPLLPALLSKLFLGLACTVLPLLVLRNLRRRQQEAQAQRRRYQDIFEGAGVGLCVFDLRNLRQLLTLAGIRRIEDITPWLQAHPTQHGMLREAMCLTEANQVALDLWQLKDASAVWARLIGEATLDAESLAYKLLVALLAPGAVELEFPVCGADAMVRHVWAQIRIPEDGSVDEVILSLNDITQRKQAQLSLVERERFWSDVVRAVPDHLYVADVLQRRMLYSNHHLGMTLGYTLSEVEDLGDLFWEALMHPVDAEQYRALRQYQRDTAYAGQLQCQLRFQHRDGSWRRFDIREHSLSEDGAGHVTRIIGVAKDVTEQIEASQSLRDSEQRYRMLAESISDVIFSTDSRLKLNYVSPSVHTMLGYDVQSVFDNGWQSTVATPSQVTGLEALLARIRTALGEPALLAQLRNQVKSQTFMLDCLRADGRKIPIELRLVLIWDEHDNFEGMLGVGRDVSQQRRAEKDLRMAATVFQHSTSAILITDPAGYIVQVNEAFNRVTGYQAPEVLDQLPVMLTVTEQQEAHLQYVVKQLRLLGSWEGEIRFKRRNGEHYPAWVGITAVLDEEGDLASYVCFFSDISERKASEQRIHRLAYYDALTHLPNRTLFQDRLFTALQQAERQKAWVVLMFLDLDRFKPINDSLGHAAGDRMLKDMAMRLLACVDEDDTVARMGGDEFTLLLQPRGSREAALNRAIHVAEEILGNLHAPFVLENREFFVTASIGIALSPQDGSELSQLMKNADTAMYHAKERGKNNFQFYQADMNASALERLELESDLRHALEQKEFVLYYQPQLSGDGKRLTGAEALLRWRHPRRGLVPPQDFIPVLEELGLVVDVGDWVLTEACRQLKAWHQAKVRVPKVSVNISARQFSDGQLGKRIAHILNETGVPPACLELELTESILMREVNEAMHILDNLKVLGLSIAVDDFGTGYSSLNYLKQFPIDVLKIDRTFVDGLPEGEQDAQIARAIIAMAHSLNLAVIAEGVETHEQLDFLREHGCDEVQGYLFGRPMQANRFEAQFSNDALFMFD
ncbi:EAL domain-containing protein [Pseudomonas sp. RIT-PI-S]|uniref:sensor domain-containing protein n=1 Tax=Pseudomonas sp. RIT-PI-S TaxID=3035295 RepID=UPI0021DB4019|nr:EAL domain-containing protein [Pseudomonas sp. RIT-PI-S]